MKKHTLPKLAGVMICAALMWSLGGAIDLALNPFSSISGIVGNQARAESHENPSNSGNPCNPDDAEAAAEDSSTEENPSNPCAAAAKKTNPDNPCNPCASAAKDGSEANPCNPCNPCGGAAKDTAGDNPCNPDNQISEEDGDTNNDRDSNNDRESDEDTESVLVKESNPCNPCSAGGKPVGFGRSGGTVNWAKDYRSWPVVSGYVKSASHGNRLVQTFITPAQSASIFKNNSRLILERRTRGFKPYPQGTLIVQESWVRNDTGAPGRPGPIFFMRKESPGYDEQGGDWHYGMAHKDMTVIGEGKTTGMSVCKECHTRARSRDFVFSTDR